MNDTQWYAMRPDSWSWSQDVSIYKFSHFHCLSPAIFSMGAVN